MIGPKLFKKVDSMQLQPSLCELYQGFHEMRPGFTEPTCIHCHKKWSEIEPVGTDIRAIWVRCERPPRNHIGEK